MTANLAVVTIAASAIEDIQSLIMGHITRSQQTLRDHSFDFC